ncbi:hypothetical protein F1654_07685 [Alkalicaulis satelles]|uniref:Uncharacterized protein n=1 Tax=Alkalicaulis satelles TaxID=2609175 RepID=A0A5M6ZG06_9PROT|nr:hypothetical protein [Alkalicaulis satelles]KAA5803673.1 hypothetical protein F1654_07685 [Alkalicaulis satelles]
MTKNTSQSMSFGRIAISALTLNIGVTLGLWFAARGDAWDMLLPVLVATNLLVGGVWAGRLFWRRARARSKARAPADLS